MRTRGGPSMAASSHESTIAMSGLPWTWRERLQQALPTRDSLGAHPWLRPVAKRLLDPRLWRLREESVARGAAIGAFWAFVIPIAQLPVAAAHCSWWRANIPVAAAATLLTNPLTIGFWLWLAYQLGAALLGSAGPAPTMDDSAMAWLAAVGWPTVVGMGVLACSAALLGYGGVKLAWRLARVWRRWRRGRRG